MLSPFKPEHNFFFGTLVPQGGVKPCADRIVENHAAMSLYTQQYKGENLNIADNGVYKELMDFFLKRKRLINAIGCSCHSLVPNKHNLKRKFLCLLYFQGS